MKEDILEQLVDSYFLRKKGTFTKHNIKFRPELDEIDQTQKKKYAVHSDIDVLAVQMEDNGQKEVSVISCKSWQNGFDIDLFYDKLIDPANHDFKIGTGPIWKKFRELVDEKWAKAFRSAIYRETKTLDFTYYIAVTKVLKDSKRELFENCEKFLDNLSDDGRGKVTIKFLTLETILREIESENHTTTIESTEIGRFLQLIRAAKIKFSYPSK